MGQIRVHVTGICPRTPYIRLQDVTRRVVSNAISRRCLRATIYRKLTFPPLIMMRREVTHSDISHMALLLRLDESQEVVSPLLCKPICQVLNTYTLSIPEQNYEV